MKHKSLKANLLAFIFVLSCNFIWADNNIKDTNNNYLTATELYNSANFIAAERLFNDLIEQSNDNDPLKFDLDYYRLMCLVKQNKSISEAEITKYLAKTNGSPWENQLWYELSKLQFNNKRYKVAARTFNKVDKGILSKKDQEDYTFFKGYSNFEAGNLRAASQAFFEVKRTKSTYTSSASYYWGYINYLEGNYETALDEFSKLENDKQFAGFIKYYTTQIYYLQEKYDQVIKHGEKLVAGAPAQQKNELLKIVGDAFYETNRYISAVKYLDAYKGVNGKKTPEDYFRLGYCYYQMKDYEKAITVFDKATFKKDELAQVAFYHLADCYLNLDDKNKAKTAFEQASKYSFDPKIEEDALFNFAKLTYELSYSPFNETIKAFDQYIAKYPDSERNDAAFDYLVKVYMTTRNYKDAISSIEKIQNKTSNIKEAYQRVTYYRGLELLNDRRYTDALKYFQQSVENGQYNRKYKAKALYWMGETNYTIRKYDEAIGFFTQFQASPGAFSLTEFAKTYYNLGYCYFNQKIYDQSTSWFRKYLNQSQKEPKMQADALNRIADYYYLNRDYEEAIKHYHLSAELAAYDPDYAKYQQAICYGLDRDYDSKILILNSLINEYPRSSFIDDAMFEIAKTNERKGQLPEAIDGYNRLIKDLAKSNFTKKAYLQLGLIYYNKSDYNYSLENYKKVVEEYPNSEESKAALLGIKNNYIDMNNVDGYFTYTKTLGNLVSISVNEQDSIFYMVAEKSYMDRASNAGTQLEQYLNRFPDGSFKLNALFYLAEFQYNNKEYTKSLGNYEEVVDRPDHIFTEQALIKAGELTFNAGIHDRSLEYFTRLDNLANTKWNIIKARLGIMRNNFKLEQWSATVKSAITLLATDNVSEMMIREANYNLAKSYYMIDDEDNALKYFRLLAEDTKSIEGAESKYFVAQILYNKNKTDDCENEIMDFISKNTPHQYWLAKSFILLSNVYLAKDDLFQAKHTLSSIINNYNIDNDGIINEAKRKIADLELLEKETILTKEDQDSTQTN